MKFEQILEAFRSGKKIKRTSEYGEYSNTDPSRFGIAYIALQADDWEIIEVPKQKVKRYKWAVKDNGYWADSSSYYSDAEVKNHPYYAHGKKLDHTETEFDE